MSGGYGGAACFVRGVDPEGNPWCEFPKGHDGPHSDASSAGTVVSAAEKDALRIVRLIERDMAEQALNAWRSADARHGLSDHSALIVYADALSRWSQRLRMALNGEDYLGDTRVTRPAPLQDGGQP